MDEIMNLMIADESPSEISDSIKTQLMQKAGARVDALKPAVANAMLGYEVESEEDVEPESETVGELDNEEETEEEDYWHINLLALDLVLLRVKAVQAKHLQFNQTQFELLQKVLGIMLQSARLGLQQHLTTTFQLEDLQLYH